MRKLGFTAVVDDRYVEDAVDPRYILGQYIAAALDEINTRAVAEGAEVNWKTLDLRIFRDVDIDSRTRNPYLTLRAQALTKESPTR